MSSSWRLIAPSILASDFACLRDECQDVLDAGADWLHVDVMDGHFVPNITIGLPVVRALRSHFPEVGLDVHLMISDPDQYAEQFVDAGATIVTFHPEASYHPHRLAQRIRAKGARAGLALNPGTGVEGLRWLDDVIDLVLVVSVNPGFGGQKFIESAVEKIAQLDAIRRERASDWQIEVDGGINPQNIGRVAAAGADVLVAGSAIFGTDDYGETIALMRQAMADAAE